MPIGIRNKKKYYVVMVGRNPGVYDNWDDCNKQIKGFDNMIYKSFLTKQEAHMYYLKGEVVSKCNSTPTASSNPKDNATSSNPRDITSFFKLIKEDKRPPKNGKTITVYTDGDSFMHDKKRYSGYGIFFKEDSQNNVHINFEQNTNNRCELMAIMHAIEIKKSVLEKGFLFNIITDSQYAIQIFGMDKADYRKKKSKKTLINEDLVTKAINYNDIYHLKFTKVKSHTDNEDTLSIGNDKADHLAMYGSMECYYGEKVGTINLSHITIQFGKYKDKKFTDVPITYLKWIVSQREMDIKNGLLYRQISLFLDRLE